eukprot:7365758-Heterocapsa_arctica.AAC.1
MEAGVCATSVNSSCAGVAFDRMLFPANTPRARYLTSLSRPGTFSISSFFIPRMTKRRATVASAKA